MQYPPPGVLGSIKRENCIKRTHEVPSNGGPRNFSELPNFLKFTFFRMVLSISLNPEFLWCQTEKSFQKE